MYLQVSVLISVLILSLTNYSKHYNILTVQLTNGNYTV
jgi:hypothetical protein